LATEPEQRSLAARIWAKRPLVLYAFVFLVVMVMLAGLVVDRRVSAYEQAAERDPETGILAGAEPIRLGDPASPAAVLFVHGFIGAPSNWGKAPAAAAAAGWRAEAIIVAGHGTTPRNLEQTTADDMIDGVREALAELQENHEIVVLAGQSMGGAIAAIVAADTPMDGLFLASPFFGITRTRLTTATLERLTRFAATFVRWVPAAGSEPPIFQAENRKHIVSYRWVPLRGALEALRLSRRAVAPEVLSAIDTPVMLLHSHKDEVTCPKASGAALEAIGAERKEGRWLERSNHVIFWDYDSEECVEAMLAFLATVWEAPDPDGP